MIHFSEEEGEATSPNPGAANNEGAEAVGEEEGEGEGETLTTEAAEVVEAKAVVVGLEVAVDLRHISGEGTLECGMPHNRRERTPSTEGKGPLHEVYLIPPADR